MKREKPVEIINDLLSKGEFKKAKKSVEWAKEKNLLSSSDELEIQGSFIIANSTSDRAILAKSKIITQSLAGLQENREGLTLKDITKSKNKYILCHPHLTPRLYKVLTSFQLRLYLILFGTLPFAFSLPQTKDKTPIDFKQVAKLLNTSPNVIYNTYRKIVKRIHQNIKKYPLYGHFLRSFIIEWGENRFNSPEHRQKLIKYYFCRTLNLIAKSELTKRQYFKWVDYYNIQKAYHRFEDANELYSFLSKKWCIPPSKVERTITRCNDRINSYIRLNRPLDTTIHITK